LRSSESNDFGDLFFVLVGGYGILRGCSGLRCTNQAIMFQLGIATWKTSVAEVSGLRSTRSNPF